MKTRVPDYFKQFKCIASQCEDTCCAGWEIVIDDETYDIYKSVEGQFGKRLKDEIYLDGDNEHIFKLKGNDCAFLNKNKMCDIYSELGEEALCYTCQQYPRYTEEFGSIREVGLSLSCPEAARIILGTSKITDFETSEDDGMVPAYNDISFDIFMQLSKSRKVMFEIIQNRSIDLNDRIAIVLSFSQEIQKKIDDNRIDEIAHICEKYCSKEFINKYIDGLDKYKNNYEHKYNNMKKYFMFYKNLDHINERWPHILNDVIKDLFGKETNCDIYVDKHRNFNSYYVDNFYEYEHLIVYFIFRYFMKAVFDYDVSSKIKMAVVSYLMIKELGVHKWSINNKEFAKEDQVVVMRMYSKDIEHSDDNMEALYETFESADVFKEEELLTMLMN
ncbi:MAG: flagellar protein FliB [Clostridium butyricum]|nr:flagellar protein FliB [Clostridium butyricum]